MTSKWHGRIARRDEDNARYSIADIIFFIITLPPGFDNGLWDRDRLQIFMFHSNQFNFDTYGYDGGASYVVVIISIRHVAICYYYLRCVV